MNARCASRFVGIAVAVLTTGVAYAQQSTAIIKEVRAAIAQKDFGRGEALVSASRRAHGITPEMLEALSWLGRGALADGHVDKAETYARQTYDLARSALAGRHMDQEPHLPIALGAAIEVMAHAGAARGARTEAVQFLQTELETYGDTSLHKRIQKNINLLSLEGTVAPALDASEYLGARPPALAQLKGRVLLLFFWAHWCSDCKSQAPILARLADRYSGQGLTIVAPTQRYGYVAGGKEAGPDEEARYIEQVRTTDYPALIGQPTPLSEANHNRYGVSSTPTLVLVDRQGVVRLYHPGRMTEQELDPLIRRLVTQPSSSQAQR